MGAAQIERILCPTAAKMILTAWAKTAIFGVAGSAFAYLPCRQ